MRKVSSTPLHLLPALFALLYVTAGPAASEPDTVNLKKGPVQIGDFELNLNQPTPFNSYNSPPVDHGNMNNEWVQVDPTDAAAVAMQKLWDAWHKRVSQAIDQRFNKLAQMLFKHGPSLVCRVSYTVTKDGRIDDVRVLQPSPNATYNSMVVAVITSMHGSQYLKFPPTSKRQSMEKTDTFSWQDKCGIMLIKKTVEKDACGTGVPSADTDLVWGFLQTKPRDIKTNSWTRATAYAACCED